MSDEQQHDELDQREADQQEPRDDGRADRESASKDDTLARISQERREARERARKAEAERDALLAKQREADEAKAKEEGRFRELLEERERELADIRKQLEERDLNDKRTAIARKHNLPDEIAARLVGTTDEDIENDAKRLAKLFAREDGPDTDGGKRSASSGAKKQESLLANYEFGRRR